MEINPEVQSVLNAAYRDAKERNHEYLTAEHILYATLFFETPRAIIEECGADPDTIKEELEQYFTEHIPGVSGSEPVQSAGFQNVIEHALFHTESSQKGEVDIGDILISIYDLEQSYGAYYLKKSGITRLALLNVISHGGVLTDPSGFPDASSTEDESETAGVRPKKRVLELFTVELTGLAQEGKLDPLIGREDILERTMQVLCRRLKNNPVFVGEPGVGKTAIAEGLAQRIVDEKVPGLLKGFRVFALDMGSVIAGTRFRGDFEERIKKVMKYTPLWAREQYPEAPWTPQTSSNLHSLQAPSAVSARQPLKSIKSISKKTGP